MPPGIDFDNRIKDALTAAARKKEADKKFHEQFEGKVYKAALVNEMHASLLQRFGYAKAGQYNQLFPIDKALKEESERILREGAESYNNWTACQMSLIRLAKLLEQDITFTNLEIGPAAWACFVVGKAGELGEQGVDLARHGIHNAGAGTVKARLKEIATGKAPEIGELYASVNMDASNKLECKDFLSSLNLEMAPSLNNYFKAGIDRWLDINGYTEEAARPGHYVTKGAPHTPLNQVDFERMKADPDFGLEKYLSGRFEMSVQLRAKL